MTNQSPTDTDTNSTDTARSRRRDLVRDLDDRLDRLDDSESPDSSDEDDEDLSERQIDHIDQMVATARRNNPDAVLQAHEALLDEQEKGITSDPGELTAGELALINAMAGRPPTEETEENQ